MSKNYSPIKAAAICSFTGHKLQVTHQVNDRIQELCCVKCGKQMTTNIYGNIVPLSDQYSRINRALNDLAVKKNRRELGIYS
ncbi:hypothetical protein BST92_06410 [Nonlabens arenilitoris]|uniref:Prophage protein n=1 Tax=Nonlabens arenilitoris TaxID=1217969 RepID=A0A2S7UAF5_9FLAO|nr:hypothetical protein [Nonlabens arenilitoris]PQJ31581.1 hypothetical protein BST92_06410 [Nonlabens arenilitoris]